MGFTKFGIGEILPDGIQKVLTKWSKKDQQELEEELDVDIEDEDE